MLGWRVSAINQHAAALWGWPGRSKPLAMHPWSSATLADAKAIRCLWGRRLVTIALRVVTVLEGVVRSALAKPHQEMAGLFVDNPTRRTSQLITERLLEAFNEIILVIFLLFLLCDSRW
jgi:hypothetical protein